MRRIVHIGLNAKLIPHDLAVVLHVVGLTLMGYLEAVFVLRPISGIEAA
jgi:hypothetical protein